MVCNHWIKHTVTFENVETGETRTFIKIERNNKPYHVAIHRLEHFISKIVTANFRRSWVLNDLLNNSRFTPFYWQLKAVIFRADEVVY